jgi:hypothetical protein
MKINYFNYMTRLKVFGILSSLTINTHSRYCPIMTQVA